MDATDLIKLAPAVSKVAGIIVGGVPVAEIVKAILVPSAQALGKRMSDRVERLFEKTAKMIDDAGVTPQPVEDKFLVEILRSASLEDNEDLHTMWAALLANAATPPAHKNINPAFVATLKRLAPDEAKLLNWIFDRRVGPDPTNMTAAYLLNSIYESGRLKMNSLNPVEPYLFSAPLSEEELEEAYHSLEIDTSNVYRHICFENLETERLIEMNEKSPCLTLRGISFVHACRPPAPKG